MSIKKKIRRAFDAATPDVLDRVLQECPQQEQAPAPVRKSVPHWFKEAAATAAAFAFLIAICGGTIWFGLDRAQSGSDDPTDPTPTTTEPTDPTGYDVSDSDVDFDALPDHSKTLIDPQWDETSDMNMAAAYITELNGVIVYHIEIQYNGYWYYFDYDAYTADLVDIGLIACDCIKEGYISQDVVREILNLAYSIEIGDDAQFVLTDDAGGAYYAVFPFGTSLSSSAFYVNAYSGEILDMTGTDAELPKTLIRDVALAYADVKMEDVRYLNICPLAAEEKYYLVEIIVDTSFYTVSVNYDGTILDVKAEQTDYTQWTDVMVWQDARDIALAELGLTLSQITGLEFSYNDVYYQYTFSFTSSNGDSYHTVVDTLMDTITSAEAIANLCLYFDLDPTLPMETELIQTTDTAYYCISVTTSSISYAQLYYVHAGTGDVLDIGSFDGDLIRIRDLVLDFVGVNCADARTLTVEVMDDNVHMVTVESSDTVYMAFFDPENRKPPELQSFPAGARVEKDMSSLIGWSAARDIALASAGNTINEMCYFSYFYDTGNDAYNLTLAFDDTPCSYLIDARNGNIQYCSNAPSYSAIVTEADVWNAVLNHEALPESAKSALRIGCTRVRYCSLFSGDGRTCYVINLTAGGVDYWAEVDIYNGTISRYEVNYLDEYTDIEHFQSLLSNCDDWYSRALTCEYYTNAGLQLQCLFYNGFTDEAQSSTNSDAEDLDSSQQFDWVCLPVSKMNAVLSTYFDITLDDLNSECFDGLYYESDCYYLSRSGTIFLEDLVVTAVEQNKDGSIQVYYTATNLEAVNVVTLKPVDNGYQILSNLYYVTGP